MGTLKLARVKGLAVAMAAALGCTSALDLGQQSACPDAGTACVVTGVRRCVDLQTDPAHCGACGTACAAGQPCDRGRCCAGAACVGRCQGTTFETQAAPGGREFTGMYLRDIDRDGYDDLVEVNQLDENLYVFWGNADGRLGEPSRWAIGRANGDVAFGDVDGNGATDLVVTVQSNGPPTADRISVFLRQPGRELGTPLHQPEAGNPDEIALGDFDRDGRLDVLTRRMETGCLLLKPGDGRGHFFEGRCVATLGVGPDNPAPLIPIDLDRDGHLEVVSRVGELNVVYRFAPSGDVARRDDLLPSRPQYGGLMVAYDVDRDGRAELAWIRPVAPSGGLALDLLPVQDGRVVTPACAVAPSFAENLWTVGDFNGDGMIDGAGVRSCAGCPETALLHLRR